MNAIRILRNAIQLRRETAQNYRKSAKKAPTKEATQRMLRLAAQEEDMLEVYELVHDSLAEKNEWLTIKDILEESEYSIPKRRVRTEGIRDAVDFGIGSSEETIES